jgi:hypothetical protein
MLPTFLLPLPLVAGSLRRTSKRNLKILDHSAQRCGKRNAKGAEDENRHDRYNKEPEILFQVITSLRVRGDVINTVLKLSIMHSFLTKDALFGFRLRRERIAAITSRANGYSYCKIARETKHPTGLHVRHKWKARSRCTHCRCHSEQLHNRVANSSWE